MITLGLDKETETKPLDLGLTSEAPVVTGTPEQLERRATKAHFAMGEDSPGLDNIRNDFWEGHENRLREYAASRENIRRQAERGSMVRETFVQAQQEQRPLSFEDEELIKTLTTPVATNPNTVLEEQYGKKFTEAMIAVNPQDTYFGESYLQNDEGTHAILDAAQFAISKQELARNTQERIHKQYNDSSWARWGVDFVETTLPLVSWLDQMDRIEGVNTPSWLLGNNKQEQIEGLWMLPPDQFQEQLNRAVDEIAANNIIDAKMFVDAVLSYSQTDQFWDNAVSWLDAVGVAAIFTGPIKAGVTASGKLATSGLTKLSSRMKAGISANTSTMTVSDVVATAGNIAEAGKIEVLTDITKATTSNEKVFKNIAELGKKNFGMLDIETWTRNAGSLTGEYQRRLRTSLDNAGDELFKTVDGIASIERIDLNAARVAAEAAEVTWRKTYPHLEDAIIDVRPERTEVFGGYDTLNVYIGTKKATSFTSPERAQRHAKDIYGLKDGTYDVVMKDGNYLLRMTQNVNETDNRVLDMRVQTDNPQGFSVFNALSGAIRTPDEILSEGSNEARKMTHATGNAVMRAVQNAAKSLGGLGKNERERVKQILEGNRFEEREYLQPDGKKVKLPGNYYNSIPELEQAYRQKFNKLPSFKEVDAYFKMRLISDYDYVIRNMSMYRDKARLGVQQYSLGVNYSTNGRTSFVGSRSRTGKVTDPLPFFEGRKVDRLPSLESEPFTIAMQNEKTGKWQLHLSNRMNPNIREQIENAVKDGNFQIIQTFNSMDPVLMEAIETGGEAINYVVGVSAQTKPLNPLQIGYRAGGHTMYPERMFYIKQAKTWTSRFGRKLYGNDVSVHAFPSQAQANKFVKNYEAFREALVRGADEAELEKLSLGLPVDTMAEARSMFRQFGGDNAPFDVNIPFAVTRSGQRYTDVRALEGGFNQDFLDLGRSEHNLFANVNSRFSQERNEQLTTIAEMTSPDEMNPIFTTTPAPVLDPFEAMKRSSKDLMRSRAFEDYKHRDIENWVHTFRPYLDATPEEITANPMQFLNNPVWREGVSPTIRLAGMNQRRAIKQILGSESEAAALFNAGLDRYVDGLYNKKGEAAVTALKPWEWSPSTNPIQMARGAVFHAKIGLFNVMQFPLQYYTGIVHHTAIDGNPLRVVQAHSAAWLNVVADMGRMNPGFMKLIRQTARKALQIPEDTWDEMYGALKRSGWDIVEGEAANYDNYFDPDVIASAKGQFLHGAAVFFRGGERMNRTGAFFTAFLRWRKENPTARVSDKVIAKLVNRADMMTMNMTRASNTPTLQGGSGFASEVASVPLQFWTFQARLSEQMLGRRLSLAEKSRIVGYYSLAYGVPVGVGGTIAGSVLPVYDIYRKWALDNGINMDDKLLQTIFEGLPQMALEMVTGEEINIAERYGPGGNSMFSDIYEGDFYALLGASGGFIKDMWENAYPFAASFHDLFIEGNTETWPLMLDSMVDISREVSSVNNTATALLIWNWGRQYTQNEVAIADVDKWSAVYKSLLGLQDQSITDAFLKGEILRDQKQAQRDIEKLALKYFNRGLRALNGGDQTEWRLNWNRSHTLLIGAGYTPQEAQEVRKRFIKEGNNKTMLDRVGAEFVLEAPEAKRSQRLERHDQERNK